MTINEALRLIAVNLIQSSFAKGCLMMTILKNIGLKGKKTTSGQ